MTKSEMSCKNCCDKLISYIGFAKKARNIYFGADKVLASSKKGAIIVARDISNNTLNKIKNHCVKTNAEVLIISEKLMGKIVQSDNIKLFQLLDKNLENAVLACLKLLEDVTLE